MWPEIRRLDTGQWQFLNQDGTWENVGPELQQALSKFVSVRDDPSAEGGRMLVRADGSAVSIDAALSAFQADAASAQPTPAKPNRPPWWQDWMGPYPPTKTLTDPLTRRTTTITDVDAISAFSRIASQMGLMDAEEVEAAQGVIVPGEELGPGLEGRQFIRQPDGSLKELEQPRQEGRIVQGETLDPGLQGRRFIVQPDGSLRELTAPSIDDMIASAIDGKDWAAALELKRFNELPSSAQRLQAALDVSRSPADYMTVLGMLRGELPIQQPTIGETGELRRIAPLSEPLQEAAQEFFRPGRFGGGEPAQTVARFTSPGQAEQEAQFDQATARPPALEIVPFAGIPEGALTPEERAARDAAEARNQAKQQTAKTQAAPQTASRFPVPDKAGPQPSQAVTEAPYSDSQLREIAQNVSDLSTVSPLVARQLLERFSESFTFPDLAKLRAVAVGQPAPAPTVQRATGEVIPGPVPNEVPRFFPDTTGQAEQEGQFDLLPTGVGQGRFSPVSATSFLPKAVRDVGISGLALSPAKQFPELGSLRFRSEQAQANMLPTERAMFEEALRLQGVPLEDFLEQERRAVGVSRTRPRLRFTQGRFA